MFCYYKTITYKEGRCSMLSRLVKIFFLFILLSSCSNTSELNYARQIDDKDSLMSYVKESFIYGRSDAARKFEVCVENNDQDFISRKALLTESMIALFHWLEVGEHPRRDRIFDSIDFNSSCLTDKDFKLAGYKRRLKIIIPDKSQLIQNSKFDSYFVKPKARCRVKKNLARCKISAFVFGFAEQFGKKVFLDSGKPAYEARIVMNPFVDWLTLGTELNSLGDRDLAKEYKELSYDRTSYSDLAIFIDRMQHQQHIGREEQPSIATLQKVKKLRQYLRVPDNPRLSLYPILLHEMGHVFGLGHADNPGNSYVTGDAHGNESIRNVYKTKYSVMSYYKKYIHLTSDDKAGITSLFNNL
jgi:hypothetical protein